MSEENICKICKNSAGNKTFTAKEMMFGTQDEFEYFQCNNCYCLQISETPENLSSYYPSSYYSLQKPPTFQNRFQNVRLYLRSKRSRYLLKGKDFLGNAIYQITDDFFEKNHDWDWFRKTGADLGSNILDIGCGAGKLLKNMDIQGFSKLTGLDPYIEKDIVFGIRNAHTIHKKSLEQLEGNFDLIMLHHSFEHMEDPISVMNQINRLLKINHFAVIRIPLSDSYAWRKYGPNWVQLDAPRHIFLHTIKSIEILSRLTGFEISDVVHDSTAFQFIGSELYVRGISLEQSKKNHVDPIFSKKEIETFQKESDDLNLRKEGDQACFYLKKINSYQM